MKLVWMRLTHNERMAIHSSRARTLTGYDVHTATKIGEGYYIWRMGQQPDPQWIEQMMRPTPIEAATAFLKVYLSRQEADSPWGYVDPVRRPV